MDGYVDFYSPIDYSSVSFLQKCVGDFIKAQGITKLHLFLSVPEGIVRESLSMYDFLKGLPIEVNTYSCNRLNTASIIAFCAGKNRYSMSNASFLFSPVIYTVENKATFEISRLKSIVNELERDCKNVLNVLYNTVNNKKVVDSLIGQKELINAQRAKEIELVTEIYESIKMNGNLISIHGDKHVVAAGLINPDRIELKKEF
jgi:ATP-dependent protease ClpP protease subunit